MILIGGKESSMGSLVSSQQIMLRWPQQILTSVNSVSKSLGVMSCYSKQWMIDKRAVDLFVALSHSILLNHQVKLLSCHHTLVFISPIFLLLFLLIFLCTCFSPLSISSSRMIESPPLHPVLLDFCLKWHIVCFTCYKLSTKIHILLPKWGNFVHLMLRIQLSLG